MSSIHYKFRSSLESKCHTFDGLHISVAELKKAIYTKEGLREESFELVLSNGHTKRTYAEPNELIPRNSSVIVQRMPRENAGKLPKVQDTSTSGIVQTVLNAADGPKHIGQEEYDKMTEEERIQHMKNVSSFKYQPANFKRQSHIMSQDVPPPPTYICNRCNQPGHWYTHCPMLNTKRTTGIPMEELMETTEDDPQAMLHPSGKYVIPIMHHRARLAKQQKAGEVPESPAAPPPPGLICPICNKIFSEAVVMVCCGNSFCGPCVQQRLLDSDTRECPGEGCKEQNVNAEKFVPNINLRKSVAQLLLPKSEGGSINGKESAAGSPAPARDEVNMSPAPEIAAAASPSPNDPVVRAPSPALEAAPAAATQEASTPLVAPGTEALTQGVPVASAAPVEDAWEAFLERKDKEKEKKRRRSRSVSRSSRSSTSRSSRSSSRSSSHRRRHEKKKKGSRRSRSRSRTPPHRDILSAVQMPPLHMPPPMPFQAHPMAPAPNLPTLAMAQDPWEWLLPSSLDTDTLVR
ncbi:hypothetical protein L596_009592 [Steinernema carpocapsae]|uniref:DWNN domain-containing protein n=1 Tax=Steinernema carpocapsae TaxID=34508 RepID=A0A4U5PFZ9_STECR|nr:hypothetical protein L596_009592 [Steinernema carpocapsae]